MKRRVIFGIAVVVALINLMWIGLGFVGDFFLEPEMVGSREHVKLLSPSGERDMVAKIDTGADFSSLDEALAMSMGFIPDPEKKKRVVTDQGAVDRSTIEFKVRLANREISSVATLADRSKLSTLILIGKNDLGGLIVDPSREFVSAPVGGFVNFFRSPVLFSSENRLGRVVLLIPVLGAIVVLLRLIIGLRTYGVFAPTIIALTLLELGILPGLIIYVFLLAAGVSTKIFVLDRFNLPRIAEFALVMSILVALLAAITPVSGSFGTMGIVFFPLIITTHLIEQAGRGFEEHGVREALLLLGSTITEALVLGIVAMVLVEQSSQVLWLAFVLSIVTNVLAGHYLGLRLTELIRFKFLRRTHVHQ